MDHPYCPMDSRHCPYEPHLGATRQPISKSRTSGLADGTPVQNSDISLRYIGHRLDGHLSEFGFGRSDSVRYVSGQQTPPDGVTQGTA